MPSTNTIQSVVNFASTHLELAPLAGVGGYTSEPALSLANDVLADLLGTYVDPNGNAHVLPWKFNRKEMPSLFLMRNQQTYQFAGASAFSLSGDAKGVGIDLASNNAITEIVNTVTVKTLDPHNFVVGETIYMTGNTVAAYNSTFTQTPDSSAWSGGWAVVSVPDSKTFTFTHASSGLAASGAPGISDFASLESASMVDANSNGCPQPIRYLRAVRMIPPSSNVTTPEEVCIVQDLQNGILRVRFNPLPGSTPYQASLVYQAKAPVLTSLSSTWSPFPDEYAFVYRQMFLAHCYRYLNSPRSEVEFQKADRAILKALAKDDRELSEEYITPDSPIDTASGLINGPWIF